MLPFKRILCATDFSDFSIEALDKACQLATHFGAELLAVHVTQTVEPVYGFAPYSVTPIQVDELKHAVHEGAEAELKKLLELSQFAPIRTRAIVREGHPAKQIVELASDENADLIVISTHGLTGWRHLVSGSVAENVVRLAACPVLVVPAREAESRKLEAQDEF